MTTEALTYTAIIDKPTAYLNVPDIITDYRVVNAIFSQIATPAGSGAGASVTISFSVAPVEISGDYSVLASADQECFCKVTNRTSTGFDVVLTPPTALLTLAAGFIDVQAIFQK